MLCSNSAFFLCLIFSRAAKRRFKVLLDLEKLEQRNAQREFVGQELDNRTGRP